MLHNSATRIPKVCKTVIVGALVHKLDESKALRQARDGLRQQQAVVKHTNICNVAKVKRFGDIKWKGLWIGDEED